MGPLVLYFLFDVFRLFFSSIMPFHFMRFDKYKLHDQCHGVSFTNSSLIIFLSDVLDQE